MLINNNRMLMERKWFVELWLEPGVTDRRNQSSIFNRINIY